MLERPALLCALLLLCGSAAAQDSAGSSDAYPEREFGVSLYVWGTELHGTVDTGHGSEVDADVKFRDVLKNTNMAAFAAASGRVGRFVGLFDGMYADLEADENSGTVRVGPVTAGPAELDVEAHQILADLKLGYRILEPAVHARQPVSIDLLAGGRYVYMHNEADLDFPVLADQHFSGRSDWIDPLVGVRVIIGLTPRIRLTAIGDVGGWSAGTASDRTYQATGFFSVQMSQNWSLMAGYKVVDIERGHIDLEIRGPVLGTLYRF